MSHFDHCVSPSDLRQIHGRVVKCGLGQDVFAICKIVERCAVFGDMNYGISVFDTVEKPDGFLWNTMIRGLGNTDQPEKAIDLYKRMREIGQFADCFTFSILFKVSEKFGSDVLGKQIHGSALRHGLESQVHVRNTMVHMYGRFGKLGSAVQVFDEMPERDLVSWNTLIGCHVHGGKCEEALRLFSRMLKAGVRPNDATLLAAISACSDTSALELGRRVHSLANVVGVGNQVPISNLLVHMYAQCGEIDKAYEMFRRMRSKTLVSWNTVILAFAMHGRESDALALFSEMVRDGAERPDGITFLGVLCACSRAGMVDEGRRFFDAMSVDFCIEPTLKHYGCMVDMLGRAGFVDEAYRLITNMPIECNAIVWRTLLASCRVHVNVEIGEKVRERLSQMDPNYSSDYILVADMYASTGRWNKHVKVRELMKQCRVQKPEPGISSVGN